MNTYYPLLYPLLSLPIIQASRFGIETVSYYPVLDNSNFLRFTYMHFKNHLTLTLPHEYNISPIFAL